MGAMVIVGVGVGARLELPAKGTVCVTTAAAPVLMADAGLETLATVEAEIGRELADAVGTTGV